MKSLVISHHISRCMGLLKEQEEHFDVVADKTAFKDHFWSLGCLNHIANCLGLLEHKHVDNIVVEVTLKDHFWSLKHGLEFLDKTLSLSTNHVLKHNINILVVNVEQKLESLTYRQGDGSSVTENMDSAYSGLRREMRNVIFMQGTHEFVAVFSYSQNDVLVSDVLLVNDFLLEYIGELITLAHNESNETAPSREELEEMRNVFTHFKSLFVSGNVYWESNENDQKGWNLTCLVSVLDKATCIIYSSLVGKIDEDMIPLFKNKLSKLLEEAKSLKADLVSLMSSVPGTSNLQLGHSKSKLSDSINMTQLVEGKGKSMNVELSQLHERMSNLSASLVNFKDNDEGLENPLYMEEFIEALFRESKNSFISSVRGGHEELVTKRIKSKVHSIDQYAYPKTGGLAFLEYFLGYLEELLETQRMSMIKSEIHTLYLELHPLICFFKVNEKKLNANSWESTVHLAYQAEYLIDLFEFCAGDSYLISAFLKIVEKVKNITVIVEDLVEGEHTTGVSFSSQVPSTYATTRHEYMVGHQNERERLLELLLLSPKQLELISIVGMPGLGKTTVAMNLYNSYSVYAHFDYKIWFTASQKYKRREMLLTILEQVDQNPNDNSLQDDEDLADKLWKVLKIRRYLIVIDDMWDVKVWNDLKRYLPDDKTGSRILTTTRYEAVAFGINSKMIHLPMLTYEESWELFQEAFPDNAIPDDLLSIAKDMAKGCQGLPLSIVLTARLLPEAWNEVAERVTSLVFDDPQGNCMNIVDLSFNHLPNHLQSCLLYLSTFSQDREIPMSRLTMLLAAEGFVRVTESKDLKDIAEEYMMDLISRSLVMRSTERCLGGVKTFRLHDLINEFCLERAKVDNFLTVLNPSNNSCSPQIAQRLFLNHYLSMEECLKFFNISVRSISFANVDGMEIDQRIKCFDMVHLRVLTIRFLSRVSRMISGLVHLRYLAIWEILREIKQYSELLDSIIKLQNLEVLIFRDSNAGMRSDRLIGPNGIWDMVKLRHLHIGPRAFFQMARDDLERPAILLANLVSWSQPELDLFNKIQIRKLPKLQKLNCILSHHCPRTELLPCELDISCRNCADRSKPDMFLFGFADHLTSLKVEYKHRPNNGIQTGTDCFLPNLPATVKKLTLVTCPLSSIDMLKIGSLPFLEVLKVYGWDQLLRGSDNFNVTDELFLSLRILKLKSLQTEEWIASEDSFNCLEQLWIENCFNLMSIPLCFGDAPNLNLISVSDCKLSVAESVETIEGMQHESQNMELKVYINRTLPLMSSISRWAQPCS